MLPKTPSHISTNRVRLITLIIAAIIIAIVSRLFFIQIINYRKYLDLANKQQSPDGVWNIKRGEIYFENKDGSAIPAATTKTGYLLYINPRVIADQEKAFTNINEIVPIDKEAFTKMAQKKGDPFEILKHRLDADTVDKIKNLNLAGVGIKEEDWRYYPGGSMASHVLGFVSTISDKPQGQYGIEKSYDDVLGAGEADLNGDKQNGFLAVLGRQLKNSGESGQNITLTIEPNLQQFVELELSSLQKKWHPSEGGIIVIEPKTGKIRAMAAMPSFDPNQYQNEKNFGVFLNPFVEKIFELGSVFKPLTMASALDQGLVTPDTTYIDKGQLKIDGRVIKNYDGKARGKTTMTQILEESLNTGAVFVMQKLGQEKFRDYFHQFGLAEKTNIDLPGELRGNLNNLNTNREVEFATASFGQGIAVTPLELTMALSVLANGGKLMQPSLVESAVDPKIVRQVIKPETSGTITKMLVDVVDMSLAGGQAKLPRYSMAAKTGTAQIHKESGKGYYTDQYLHSFFGYFPAYNPKFLIFMFLVRPQGVQYASQSLTSSFRNIVDFSINYYTVAPDR